MEEKKFNGDFLRQARKERGLTQAKLSELAGIESSQTISNIERGKQQPNLSTVKLLAEVLGYDERKFYRDAPKLTLKDCREDFLAWEHGLEGAPEDKLTVSAVAIDLANGWDNVLLTLNHCKSTKIAFEFLVLGGDIADYPEAPADVTKWLKISEQQVQHIQERIKIDLTSSTKEVELRIKTYVGIPELHGVRATRGDDARWWLTECRPVEGHVNFLDWGRDSYEIYKSADLPPVREFEKRFRKLWNEVLSYEVEY